MQNTLSSAARRPSLGAALPAAADSSGQPAGASDSSGLASVSASTTRSVATGPSEAASRSIAALIFGVAPTRAPAASTTRTEIESPRSQSSVRHRKVEQVDPGVTLSPQAKEVDGKHAAAAVQAITLSPASRQALAVLAKALHESCTYYLLDDRVRSASREFTAAQAALMHAATAVKDSLDSRSPRQAQLADAVLKSLADGLRGGQIQHPGGLQPMVKDISQRLDLADALIDRLTLDVAESLKAPYGLVADRDEIRIWRGSVDALMSGYLGASFTSQEPAAEARARLSHLAKLSIERPALAQALGNARFSREADTRQLARGMDRLGQAIVEHATVADGQGLGLVALKLTEYVEAGEAKAGGRAWLKYALEPYFRGSLANDDPTATVAVMMGVLVGMSYWREVSDSSIFGDGPSERSHRLNLDDVAGTFMKWASEAPPERRAIVNEALGLALHKFGKRPAASTDR